MILSDHFSQYIKAVIFTYWNCHIGTLHPEDLQSKEHKQKKQALAEELEKLKIEKKKKESDTSSDMVEMLLKKFSEAEELTNEIKSVMIEKVLVYGNNALEIYWKPDFAKYFECTELRVGKEKVHNE